MSVCSIAGCMNVLPSFRYGDVVDGKGVSDGALEFGDCLVEIGAGLQLAAAGRREFGLAL